MGDTSEYTTEEKLIASVWVHDHEREWTNYEDIRATFLQGFNKPAPSRETLRTWENAFSTGSILERKAFW
jgi:hypothetical protein